MVFRLALPRRVQPLLLEGEFRSPDGTPLRLAPGMAVQAEIHQGERTVLDYLLSPIRKVAQEAGRER